MFPAVASGSLAISSDSASRHCGVLGLSRGLSCCAAVSAISVLYSTSWLSIFPLSNSCFLSIHILLKYLGDLCPDKVCIPTHAFRDGMHVPHSHSIAFQCDFNIISFAGKSKNLRFLAFQF